MEKLDQNIMNSCTEENCSENEFVVLPLEGDAGFEEYFGYKAEKIYKAKNLFSPFENNKLMLAYPGPDSASYIFDLFFESPSVVAKNHEFEGLFAVDVTDYVGIKENKQFGELITYMRANPNTVYILFIYSNNRNEIREMHDYLSEFRHFRLVNIPLPDAEALTGYTISQTEKFSPQVEESCREFLKSHYSRIKCGYDYADYLVRNLKETNYSGDLSSLQEVTKKADAIWRVEGTGLILGY